MVVKFYILFLNGLNINMFGICEFEKYGFFMLVEIVNCLIFEVVVLNVSLDYLQFNVEYVLID